MSIAVPKVVQSPNLSIAWGLAFLEAYNATTRSRTPLLVSIGGFDGDLPAEDESIRTAVDRALVQHDKNQIAVSGMTIFPYGLWCRRSKPNCAEFSALCLERFLPRLKARDARNRLGTYFERMMGFKGLRKQEPRVVNQLSFIIDLLKNDKRWPRQSALQISCFDPAKDHTGQTMRGFPCLQQVGISHDGENGISLHAFYPTQYIFDRGYGNYLGLCHLGAFIAHETGLRFSRLNCYVGEPQLGAVTKTSVRDLQKDIGDRISSLSGGA